jgi:hypothetical protein
MQQGKANYLKSLKIVHRVLLAGQCIMLAIVLYLVMQQTMPAAKPALDKTLQVIALLVSFAVVFGATAVLPSLIIPWATLPKNQIITARLI